MYIIPRRASESSKARNLELRSLGAIMEVSTLVTVSPPRALQKSIGCNWLGSYSSTVATRAGSSVRRVPRANKGVPRYKRSTSSQGGSKKKQGIFNVAIVRSLSLHDTEPNV